MDRPPHGGLKRTGVHVDSLSMARLECVYPKSNTHSISGSRGDSGEPAVTPSQGGVTYFHFVPPSIPPSLPVRLLLKYFNDNWIRARPCDHKYYIHCTMDYNISSITTRANAPS